MKVLVYILFAAALVSCGSSERENKDLTNEDELNVSTNQTQSKEEQAQKDSTQGDIIAKDTAAAKVGR
jgi:hypothetical protein